MSRYYTRVSMDLLPFVRDPVNLGRCGLTLVREIRRVGEWMVVEFDDPGASEDYAGKEVVPTISREVAVGKDPEQDSIWISDRHIVGPGEGIEP